MEDYRQELYNRYVSRFKTRQAEFDYASYNKWCHQKYLPFLSDLAKDSQILDLGCGAGGLLGFLAREGFSNARGIDISEEMVSLAVTAGYNAQVANVFDYLKVERGQFGAIFALDFIEHFTKQELFVMLPLVRDHLEPGGLLIIQTPNGEGAFSGRVIYGDLTHTAILNPGSLTQLLMNFDFVDFVFTETGPTGKSPTHLVRRLVWSVARSAIQLARVAETGSPNRILTENMICRCRKSRV